MAYGTVAAESIQSGTAGYPPSFKDLNGFEQGQLCRAWVNFNGTGTVAIRASFNVASITDLGVGNYVVNFTNALPDANYSAIGSGGPGGYNGCFVVMMQDDATRGIATSTQCQIKVMGNLSDPIDSTHVHFSVFR